MSWAARICCITVALSSAESCWGVSGTLQSVTFLTCECCWCVPKAMQEQQEVVVDAIWGGNVPATSQQHTCRVDL